MRLNMKASLFNINFIDLKYYEPSLINDVSGNQPKVYPNPVSGNEIQIVFPRASGKQTISVYNSLGKLLFADSFSGRPS